MIYPAVTVIRLSKNDDTTNAQPYQLVTVWPVLRGQMGNQNLTPTENWSRIEDSVKIQGWIVEGRSSTTSVKFLSILQGDLVFVVNVAMVMAVAMVI